MSLNSLDFDTLSPSNLAQVLKNLGIKRFYFVYNSEQHRVETSHSCFDPLRDRLQNDQIDYAKHEGLFFEVSSTYDVIYGACIHRTCRGQGQGK